MSQAEKQAYADCNHVANNLAAYGSNNACDLFPISSHVLFNAVDTVREQFYENQGNIKYLHKSRSHSKDRKNAFEVEVIPLQLGNRKSKFLSECQS